MVNFIFYPNESYNKNRRISTINPFVGLLLMLTGLALILQKNYIPGTIVIFGSITMIISTFSYWLPSLRYSSFFMIDENYISFKRNLFSSVKEYKWSQISSIEKRESSLVLKLNNNSDVEVKPDMLSFHDLTLFFSSAEEHAAQKNIPIN